MKRVVETLIILTIIGIIPTFMLYLIYKYNFILILLTIISLKNIIKGVIKGE